MSVLKREEDKETDTEEEEEEEEVSELPSIVNQEETVDENKEEEAKNEEIENNEKLDHISSYLNTVMEMSTELESIPGGTTPELSISQEFRMFHERELSKKFEDEDDDDVKEVSDTIKEMKPEEEEEEFDLTKILTELNIKENIDNECKVFNKLTCLDDFFKLSTTDLEEICKKDEESVQILKNWIEEIWMKKEIKILEKNYGVADIMDELNTKLKEMEIEGSASTEMGLKIQQIIENCSKKMKSIALKKRAKQKAAEKENEKNKIALEYKETIDSKNQIVQVKKEELSVQESIIDKITEKAECDIDEINDTHFKNVEAMENEFVDKINEVEKTKNEKGQSMEKNYEKIEFLMKNFENSKEKNEEIRGEIEEENQQIKKLEEENEIMKKDNIEFVEKLKNEFDGECKVVDEKQSDLNSKIDEKTNLLNDLNQKLIENNTQKTDLEKSILLKYGNQIKEKDDTLQNLNIQRENIKRRIEETTTNLDFIYSLKNEFII